MEEYKQANSHRWRANSWSDRKRIIETRSRMRMIQKYNITRHIVRRRKQKK